MGASLLELLFNGLAYGIVLFLPDGILGGLVLAKARYLKPQMHAD